MVAGSLEHGFSLHGYLFHALWHDSMSVIWDKFTARNIFRSVHALRRQSVHNALILILIVTALVYVRTLRNGFLTWDDDLHVTNNPDIQSLSLHNISSFFTSSYVNMLYHPLVRLSFALEYHFFGLNPAAYHATNLLFHLANVALVFFLVLSLSQRRETAIIAACLFGLHPMHVESVAWITERKDVVYAFFYLSALIFYLRFIRQGNAKNYWTTFLCFILSLFSKPTALTLPLLLILLDAYNRRTVTVRTVLEKLPFFILSLVFGLFTVHAHAVDRNFDFLDRIFLASYALCYYIIHLFLPVNLSALHLMPIKTDGMLPVLYYLAPLPLVFLAFIGTRKGTLQREYCFGLLFFAVTLVPNINMIPVGMAVVSERYTYLAYIGLCYILAQTYCFMLNRYKGSLLPWKKVMIAGAVLVALFFGYLSYQRLGLWNNTLLLFEDAATKAGTPVEANFIRTLAYEFEGNEKSSMKLYTESIAWFDKGIALSPQYFKLYFNRGDSFHYLHKDTAAFRDYEKTIELGPLFGPAYFNRAVIELSWNKRQEACEDLWNAYKLGEHDAMTLIQANCY